MAMEWSEALTTIKKEVPAVVQQATALVVANQADANNAIGIVKAIKAAQKRLSQVFDGTVQKAHAAWKEAVALRDSFANPLKQAEATIKSKVGDWQQAERIKAAALQAKLQAEADAVARRERERLEKEAAKLKTPEKREERLAQAAAVLAPVVTITPEKVTLSGVSTSTTWKAELVSLPLLILEAADVSIADRSPDNIEICRDALATSFLTFAQDAADRFARATQGRTPVAGIRFVEVQSFSVRAS